MPGYTRQFLAPFIGGLNTELPQTQDALQYTSDELNCTILREAMRGRRYGFNIEKDGKWYEASSGEVYNSFFWKNVNKANADFLVMQKGANIYFYGTDTLPYSDNLLGSVDISEFLLDPDNIESNPIKFATGAGYLFAASPAMNLLKITYNDSDTGEDINPFSVESVSVCVRDIEGLKEDIAVDVTPAIEYEASDITYLASGIKHGVVDRNAYMFISDDDTLVQVSTEPFITGWRRVGNAVRLRDAQGNFTAYCASEDRNDTSIYLVETVDRKKTLTKTDLYIGKDRLKSTLTVHEYNLRNQGWDDKELDQFKEDRNQFPANNMQWFVGKDQSGNYGTTELLKHYFGNTPAPKGHYIIDYILKNRAEVSDILGGSKHSTYVHVGWSDVHNRSVRGANISSVTQQFPDSKGTARSVKCSLDFIRKSAKKATDHYWNGTIDIEVYGSDDYKNWTLIKSERIRSDAYRQSKRNVTKYTMHIASTVLYNTHKVVYKFSEGNGVEYKNPLHVYATSDIMFVEDVPVLPITDQVAQNSYTDVSFLGGHYFYLCGDTVLFSQTIKPDGTGYDKCYQDADPTSEDISDVISTDGGYIKFPTMGSGLALESFNRGVIVFGPDVVYGIMNTATSQFTAVDYDTVEISRAGLASRMSVVSTADQVFYWSPLGIFVISMNPQTDNTVVAQSISQQTIQYWYNQLPMFSKEYCRGAYDYVNNRIYWLFPTDPNNLTNLDGGLIYDLNYSAFMPLHIGAGNEGEKVTSLCNSQRTDLIEPTVYVKAGGNRVIAGDNKVVVDDYTDPKYNRYSATVYTVAKDGNNVSFGNFNDREFHDWQTAGYDSYLLSRPITGGDTFYNKQTPILQTLFKRTEGYKLLKKPEEDRVNVKYALNNMEYRTYIEQGGDEHLVSRTKVLNTGIAKKLEVVVDYTAPGVSSLTVSVRDINNYLNIIGSKTITDVHQRNVITLDEFADTECKGYWIVCEGLTGHYSIEQECTGTFHMHRTDMSEKQFICYSAPQTVTETKLLPKEFDLVLNEGGVDMVGGLRVSYKPKYVTPISPEYFISGFLYTVKYGSRVYEGNAASWLNIQSAPGAVTNPINISFKDLTYVDRGIPEEKELFDTVEMAEFKYSYTVNYALFKEEDYETNPVEYTTPSGAYLRMRWGWSLEDKSNRWDMVQNAYRPQKDFLHDEFVESRVHIRGRGKAYQVEVRNDDNKDFRLSGMNVIIRSPN